MTESVTVALARLIHTWIASRVESSAMSWVDDRTLVICESDRKSLFLAFRPGSSKSRQSRSVRDRIGTGGRRRPARTGWDPKGWSLDQLVRAYFVLMYPSGDIEAYVKTLDLMFSTGEVGELVALYQTLPLLPNPGAHVLRAAEGIRTNIKAVFCAMAHHNPFPAEQFNDDQWNQMVLKCLFIGVSLRPVLGLDERANASLMTMLVDFAHERRAAHRPIPAELWRCVGPFADDRAMDDLRLALKSNSAAEQQAAALALSISPHPQAKGVLAEMPDLARSIANGEFSWRTVAALEQAK